MAEDWVQTTQGGSALLWVGLEQGPLQCVVGGSPHPVAGLLLTNDEGVIAAHDADSGVAVYCPGAVDGEETDLTQVRTSRRDGFLLPSIAVHVHIVAVSEHRSAIPCGKDIVGTEGTHGTDVLRVPRSLANPVLCS